MLFIGLGILGFGLLLVSDLCGIRKENKFCSFKYVAAFTGTFFIFISSIVILTMDYRFDLSWTYRIISLLFTVLFLLLMIYSIVIEVSKNNQDKKLVTTGTYSLTRHPGVLWLFLYYMFGGIFFTNYMILMAGIIWTLVNILYVYLQEVLVFKYIFDNYHEYKDTTPMIVPNKSSFMQCLKTIHGGRNEELTRNA